MSLRLALKRSLEESEDPSADGANASSPLKGCGSRDGKTVELPPIEKTVRNSDPGKIDDFGFVEVSGVLASDVVERIKAEATEKIKRRESAAKVDGGGGSLGNPLGAADHKRKSKRQAEESPEVEEISNALQVDLSPDLLQSVTTSLLECGPAKESMEAVFGQRGKHGHESNYDGFEVETPKVLVTPPGSMPQLPHADDHCTSSIICLLHLAENQLPTRVARYEGRGKDYPTGITVSCDACDRSTMLPDSDYRRGVHLTDEGWSCPNCDNDGDPYDFEGGIARCFGELIDEGATELCDSYAGRVDPTAGDGMLALPTLVHRGPGNPSSATESRYVLFLTLRPLYRNTTTAAMYHRYNPDLQVHAGCVLYNKFRSVKSSYEREGYGLMGSFGSVVAGKGGAGLARENAELREENRRLREMLEAAGVGLAGGASGTEAEGSAKPDQAREGEWVCSKCDAVQDANRVRCGSCQGWRPGSRKGGKSEPKGSSAADGGEDSSKPLPTGGWACLKCGMINTGFKKNGNPRSRCGNNKCQWRKVEWESSGGAVTVATIAVVATAAANGAAIEHNDACESCGLGGDLLCCSTCNLVFHTGCTLPVLESVPEGDWSCCFCVAAGTVEDATITEVQEAKESVKELISRREKARSWKEKIAARAASSPRGEAKSEPSARARALDGEEEHPNDRLDRLTKTKRVCHGQACSECRSRKVRCDGTKRYCLLVREGTIAAASGGSEDHDRRDDVTTESPLEETDQALPSAEVFSEASRCLQASSVTPPEGGESALLSQAYAVAAAAGSASPVPAAAAKHQTPSPKAPPKKRTPADRSEAMKRYWERRRMEMSAEKGESGNGGSGLNAPSQKEALMSSLTSPETTPSAAAEATPPPEKHGDQNEQYASAGEHSYRKPDQVEPFARKPSEGINSTAAATMHETFPEDKGETVAFAASDTPSSVKRKASPSRGSPKKKSKATQSKAAKIRRGRRLCSSTGSADAIAPLVVRPTSLDMISGVAVSCPRDRDFLSPVQSYIRAHCVEYFAATSSDTKRARGRPSSISEGQVGVRCVFCKDADQGMRASQATSFPNQISLIRTSVTMLQCRHFSKCKFIPDSVQEDMKALNKTSHSRHGSHEYWKKCAIELGLVDNKGGIRFEPGVGGSQDASFARNITAVLPTNADKEDKWPTQHARQDSNMSVAAEISFDPRKSGDQDDMDTQEDVDPKTRTKAMRSEAAQAQLTIEQKRSSNDSAAHSASVDERVSVPSAPSLPAEPPSPSSPKEVSSVVISNCDRVDGANNVGNEQAIRLKCASEGITAKSDECRVFDGENEGQGEFVAKEADLAANGKADSARKDTNNVNPNNRQGISLNCISEESREGERENEDQGLCVANNGNADGPNPGNVHESNYLQSVSVEITAQGDEAGGDEREREGCKHAKDGERDDACAKQAQQKIDQDVSTQWPASTNLSLQVRENPKLLACFEKEFASPPKAVTPRANSRVNGTGKGGSEATSNMTAEPTMHHQQYSMVSMCGSTNDKSSLASLKGFDDQKKQQQGKLLAQHQQTVDGVMGMGGTINAGLSFAIAKGSKDPVQQQHQKKKKQQQQRQRRMLKAERVGDAMERGAGTMVGRVIRGRAMMGGIAATNATNPSASAASIAGGVEEPSSSAHLLRLQIHQMSDSDLVRRLEEVQHSQKAVLAEALGMDPFAIMDQRLTESQAQTRGSGEVGGAVSAGPGGVVGTSASVNAAGMNEMYKGVRIGSESMNVMMMGGSPPGMEWTSAIPNQVHFDATVARRLPGGDSGSFRQTAQLQMRQPHQHQRSSGLPALQNGSMRYYSNGVEVGKGTGAPSTNVRRNINSNAGVQHGMTQQNSLHMAGMHQPKY